MSIITFIKTLFAFPHLMVYKRMVKDRPAVAMAINEDIMVMNNRCHLNKGLTYYLVNRSPYRNVFYYRVGGRLSKLLKLLLPEYGGFYITPNVKQIGGGIFALNHPYGTIINGKTIGRNFIICQLTTIGNKEHGRNDLTPMIGDNVSLGANVNIIGDIKIGNNVVIGAGSVVVKDVPDNCVVAGNPAEIIKKTEINEKGIDSRSV